MATKISLVPVARWRATGYSDGPQGADGVPVLAREAYRDMLAAQWQPDDALPQMPVHDYDRTAPRGQAYKCAYGYDADARTERSSCGAECYTYRIPSDAFDAENADGVATIGSATVRIAADRYLAQGCCLWAELSSSPTPSPVSVAIGAGVGPYLVADSQTAPDGSAIAPNKRAAMQADIALDLADAAPAQYLHIHLYLADYLGTRGAWIEGGAMFEAEGADVGFSRDVEADAPGTGIDTVALDVGRVKIGTGTNEVTAAYALQHLPRAALAINFGIQGDTGVLAAEADTSFQARVTDLLAFLESLPSLWAQTPMVAASATVGYAATGLAGVSATGVSFCALVAHGLTRGRTFRGLRLANAIALNSVPCRLLVYGIADDIAIATSVADSVLRFATPLPWWGDVLSRQFRRGEATTLRVVSNSALDDITMPTATEGKTASIPVQPLAARDCAEDVSYIEFDHPFASGQLSSVVLALIPNGAPTNPESQTATVAATATRNVSVTYPAATTRSARAEAVTNGDGGSIDFTVQESIWTRIKAVVPNAGLVAGGGGWNSAVMSGPASITIANAAVAKCTGYAQGWDYDGVSWEFDSRFVSGDKAPAITIPLDFVYERPATATGTMRAYYRSHSAVSATWEDYATSEDGLRRLHYRATASANSLQFSLLQGTYIAPADWGVGTSSASAEIMLPGSAIRALPGGYVYAFASSANEGATANVVQTGTISFLRDGVAYSAAYAYRSQRRIGLRDKSTGVYVATGNSRTETATPYGDVHGFTQRLKFTGSNGSVLWASATLPLAALAGDVPYRAASAYSGTEQGIGTVAAAGLVGSVSISETYANVAVDPGLMMLVE